MVTSTGVCPVVPDKNLSQAFSCFNLVIKCAPQISELNWDPKVFPASITWSNRLRSTYGSFVPAHLSEVLDYNGLSDAPVLTPQKFSLLDYIEWYLTLFDLTCFDRMRTDVEKLEVQDCLNERCNTVFAGSTNC